LRPEISTAFWLLTHPDALSLSGNVLPTPLEYYMTPEGMECNGTQRYTSIIEKDNMVLGRTQDLSLGSLTYECR
jgi:hypothetical protein